MNTGNLASRYARAFGTYVKELGRGEASLGQAIAIVHFMREHKLLERALDGVKGLDIPDKVRFLETALGKPLEKSIERLLGLMHLNQRESLFMLTLEIFIKNHLNENGMLLGDLISSSSAEDLSPVKSALSEVVMKKWGKKLIIRENADPDIIGGYILNLKGKVLDQV